MPNPIPTAVRGWIFVLGALVGVFSAVLGPLIIALQISDEWAAVIVSAVGAVTTALSMLARSNLTSDVLAGEIGELDGTDSDSEAPIEDWGYDPSEIIEQVIPAGKHSLATEDDSTAATE